MTSAQKGKALQKAREDLGLTQEEVAKKAGINTNYYARSGELIIPPHELDKPPSTC